jgi:hypothetical protein
LAKIIEAPLGMSWTTIHHLPTPTPHHHPPSISPRWPTEELLTTGRRIDAVKGERWEISRQVDRSEELRFLELKGRVGMYVYSLQP